MNIKNMFLSLTSRTYPHGNEEDLIPILNSELEKDEFGNLLIKIGDSDVMFTSHLDTATSVLSEVNHVIEGSLIKTDGKSILGADDKAGVTIMLYMIENKIPGLYYFFVGEEVGCIGSRKVADKYKTQKNDSINKVVSFDRRGFDSIITYQCGKRCCSDKFSGALAEQLNFNEDTFSYKRDTTGLLTDSLQFISLYPECTNISVGYRSEHTYNEVQNIEHLERLAEACLKVDWANLPIERDPSKIEYANYGCGYGWNDYYDDWDGGYTSYNSYWNNVNYEINKKKTDNIWFHDKKYNYVSKIEIDSKTKKVVSVDLCSDRISYETSLINTLLTDLELNYERIEWNGLKLKVFYDSEYHTECDRNDLIEYLSELDYSKIDELDEKGINDIIKSENRLLLTEGSEYYTNYNENL